MFNQIVDLEFVFSEEVKKAKRNGKPIVALESNVITHGLPYPENAETAKKVQNAVRAGGAVPATIGIDQGKFIIGMSDEDIEKFATRSGIPKVSSRDLSAVLTRRTMGATTVASSLVIAELADIPFFASAGIGGVHRGAEKIMDISSDLVQLTRSKVAVICAGAKSILDLDLTMEFLETHCVPIISYQSDFFPAFYCTSSGIPSPHRMDDESLIAQVVKTHWSLRNQNSILITSPIKEEDAISKEEVDAVIERAMRMAKESRIRGNAITKYLMRAIDQATEGRSARANMSVLVSTANLAGRIATAYDADLRNQGKSSCTTKREVAL